METESMICLICIVLILVALPFGYYFAGPVSIIMASLGLLYIAYRRTCSSKC
jgi:hypothetical protein